MEDRVAAVDDPLAAGLHDPRDLRIAEAVDSRHGCDGERSRPDRLPGRHDGAADRLLVGRGRDLEELALVGFRPQHQWHVAQRVRVGVVAVQVGDERDVGGARRRRQLGQRRTDVLLELPEADERVDHEALAGGFDLHAGPSELANQHVGENSKRSFVT